MIDNVCQKIVCDDGFEFKNDIYACRDVDECGQNLHNCTNTCHNTVGSFTCSDCETGFTSLDDTCIAIIVWNFLFRI